MYNEAHIYFNDDLDYARFSGMFIPIDSLDVQESDALSARTTDDLLLGKGTFLKIISVKKKLTFNVSNQF